MLTIENMLKNSNSNSFEIPQNIVIIYSLVIYKAKEKLIKEII